MAIRKQLKFLGFFKKPEVQFFLIILAPLTAFFLVSYQNVSEKEQEFILIGVATLVAMVFFQTLYSGYEHYRLNKQEQAFLSISAHQMRTPLTAVRWLMSEITANDNKPEERKDLGRVAEIAITKLNNIIDSFSALARIGDAQLAELSERLDICDLIEKAVTTAEPVSRQYGVAVFFEGPCEDLYVKVDPVKLEIVFSNLINNGVKYNHRGGMVTVGARRVEGGKKIEVMVRDTGIGIPEAEQGRIFGQFFRGKQAQQINLIGVGLGLYMTKQIIEQHRGQIWFESAPGKGTTFHFTLPSSR